LHGPRYLVKAIPEPQRARHGRGKPGAPHDEKWNPFADHLIFLNTMQGTRGAGAAGRDEADVRAESTCASAGHAGAKPRHRSAGSGKGANAGGRTEPGPQQVLG
jgi:hypothetical protein